MDNLERKLEQYNENNPVKIRGEFLSELKALETGGRASKRPRRRRILPIAAIITLVLLLGSGMVWLRMGRPGSAPTPDSDAALHRSDEQALAGPEDSAKPESPSPADANESTPAKPEKPSPAEPDASAQEKPEEPGPETPDAPPAKSDAQPAKSDTPTPEKPEEPVPPEVPAPTSPEDLMPTPPEEQTPAPPEEQMPAIPDEPENPDPPAETPPTEDPPVPSEPPEIGAVYLSEGSRETLILTLLSTGESVDIDVSGWMERIPPENDLPPEQSGPRPSHGRSNLKYYGSCAAFGETVNYCLTFDENGEVYVELDVVEPE